MSEKLILLGRWPESPLIAWPGYCDAAQESFVARTGFRLEPFTLLRDGLHEQYYFFSSVEPIRIWFDSLDPLERMRFVEQLYDQYYLDADALGDFTDRLSAINIATASADELGALVREWMILPGRLAGPIWFAVLLDIWYQGAGEVASLIEMAAEARDHCSRVYDIQAKREAHRLFSEVAERCSTDYESLEMLCPEEILDWLSGNVNVAERVAARREFFVSINRDGHYSIVDGNDASALLSDVALAELGEVKQELQGISAFEGTVSGLARRVLSPADFESFREGEILVAYQTSVTYEPLFDRARAVVTELGGATSHAAVVCRERKIPCIVSVSNLICSAKNGDELSLDASLGTIRVRPKKADGV